MSDDFINYMNNDVSILHEKKEKKKIKKNKKVVYYNLFYIMYLLRKDFNLNMSILSLSKNIINA